MSEDQLEAFLKAVKADTTLQEKIDAASGPDAVVAIAKAAGFIISNDYFLDLSEEELESAAGGAGAMAASGIPTCGKKTNPNCTHKGCCK